MRIFLSVIITIFGLQSWTQADDIRNLEIEGMSIGDSAKIFFQENEINKYFYPKSKRFYYSTHSINNSDYDEIQIHLKDNDNNLNSCLKKKKLMTESVKSIMPSDTGIFSDDDGYPHSQKFPKSLIYTTEFVFKNGDVARVYCLNWSRNAENNRGWTDHLSLNIQTAKFFDWLNYEAYD